MRFPLFKPLIPVLALAFSTAAQALTIGPGSAFITGTDNSNLSPSEISALYPALGSLSLLYKAEVGGSDSGTFANSYNTVFLATPNDPSGAIISYVPPGLVPTANPLYLYVKDGNQNPAFYIINISGWNGTENLVLENFWPQQGAISNLQILGGSTGGQPGPRPGPEGTGVADGGNALALLGTGLVLLSILRRKFLS